LLAIRSHEATIPRLFLGHGAMITATMKRPKTTGIVLILLCLMYAFIYIDRANIGIAASAIQKEFGLGNTEMGLVFSAFSYAYASIVWASGYFSDRFGPRMTFFVCG
jgi:ACS family glucarate transporter-like MFS transporter